MFPILSSDLNRHARGLVEMEIANNTILITGGASGIGLAFAIRFLEAGNQVIICGRRQSKLEEVLRKYPGIHTRVCDVASEEDRTSLVKWVLETFPQINVLINNAGIQRRVDMLQSEEWKATREEIVVNLEAPIHLTRLLIPHLLKQPTPAIVNVTSGLSFFPKADTPVYSATKAGLHSFTLSLRHQLMATPIKVVEVIPPAVDTDLGGVGLHTWGVPLDEFADAIFAGLKDKKLEVAYGLSDKASQASRAELDAMFRQLNKAV